MTPDIHGLAGAYALAALDDVERVQFERHLASCSSCQPEVAELVETAARLGGAAAEPPPPGLRDRVLAEVDVTRQQAPGAGRGLRGAWTRWERVLVPAVAAAAAVVLTVVAVGPFQERPGTPDENEMDAMTAIVAAPDAEVVPVPAEAEFQASVVRAPSMGQAVLAVSGLAGPRDGEVYVVWSYREGQPVREEALSPSERGHDVVMLSDPSAIARVAVSREPRPDVTSPTGPVVAVTDL